MHPEADALLDAIFDHPDDDTPRLVYADWLEERGQANYAQFIRLQCAAAREKLWSDEANRLWEEIGRVWNRLDEEWWPATRETWYGSFTSLLDAIDFHRGFPLPTIAATEEQIIRYNDCWPWLSIVGGLLLLNTKFANWGALSSRILQRIHRLTLSEAWLQCDLYQAPDTLNNALNCFLQSAYLCNVRVLDLRNNHYLAPITIQILLTAPNLASVEEVVVVYPNNHSRLTLDDALPKLRERFPRVTINY